MGDVAVALVRRIVRTRLGLYPPVVSKLMQAYAKVWRLAPEKEWPLARVRVIRSTVKRLKTDRAIGRWLREQTSPGNYMMVHTAMDRLEWEACLYEASDERHQRLRLKLGDRYFLRDAILVGLSLYEEDGPGNLM